MKRFGVYIALAVLVMLLLCWPLTYRYTSLGVDSEFTDGQHVHATYYRVRWPGNGVVMIGYLVEQHHDRGKQVDAFDLGGVFLQPARPAPPQTVWNWLGFWWVNVDRSRGDADSPTAPRASRALLLGVPHWLLVVGAATLVWWGATRRSPSFR